MPQFCFDGRPGGEIYLVRVIEEPDGA